MSVFWILPKLYDLWKFFRRNPNFFGIKEFLALENYVLVKMLLCFQSFQRATSVK